MTGGVFLKRGDELVEMVEQRYELEDHLQELIERHPNLLAGDQVNPDAPRRWLLVKRETGVPLEEGGSSFWSLDHLLLDQDAIPTLVEAKRSSDPRARREVVAQMLDYAANAVTYWNLDLLRAEFEEREQALGGDPETIVADLVAEPDADYGEFWERARTNLRAGRIRLVFVADSISTELQRIVEFLNQQMSPAEVIAIEIRQYTGGDEQMLVPRVIGQTAEALQKTGRGRRSQPGRRWDEQSLLQDFRERHGDEVADVARTIIEWSREHLPRAAWGRGASVASVTPERDYRGRTYYPISIRGSGQIVFLFQHMGRMPPFDQQGKQLEFLERVNAIPGVSITEAEAFGRRPRVALEVFANPTSLAKLFEALEWFLGQATAA